MPWYEIKTFLSHGTGISTDALHVMVGVCAQLAAALVTRCSVGNVVPWFIVLGVELVNEANDFWVEIWPDAAMQYGEGFKDVICTMALPTLLLLTTRYAPGLVLWTKGEQGPQPSSDASEHSTSAENGEEPGAGNASGSRCAGGSSKG